MRIHCPLLMPYPSISATAYVLEEHCQRSSMNQQRLLPLLLLFSVADISTICHMHRKAHTPLRRCSLQVNSGAQRYVYFLGVLTPTRSVNSPAEQRFFVAFDVAAIDAFRRCVC